MVSALAASTVPASPHGEAPRVDAQPADRQQNPRLAPTLQSHQGLGHFAPGIAVTYARGQKLPKGRTPLFPIQAELEQWAAEVNKERATDKHSGHAAELAAAQTRIDDSPTKWQQCALVDRQAWARVRRHPTHRIRDTPTYIVPMFLAKGVKPAERPFPLAHQIPVTTRPTLPAKPPHWLQMQVHRDLRNWEDCVSSRSAQQLKEAVAAAQRDETIRGAGSLATHRQRAKCGDQRAEVRIGPDQFHPTVNKVLRLGFTIDLTRGTPHIRQLRLMPRKEWGINTREIIADANAAQWPDKELLFFLEYGFMDYSGNAPPICSFSPHQQKAFRELQAFQGQVREEIRNGWIGPAFSHPPSIPFQVRPGSIEPKPEGKFRLVWNASWPQPGSTDSMVDIGNGWCPIAPNACTVLPSELAFEWSAIESNNEAISIMAEGARRAGVPLLGRTFDITKWFRQLAMASIELWKGTVYAEGGFREDRRMQMGRRSSAHSAQRTTLLLTALLQRAAWREQWGVRRDTRHLPEDERAHQRALTQWLQVRRGIPNPAPSQPRQASDGRYQDTLVHFSSFQDDITVLALGWAAAKDTTQGVHRILHLKYGVPLSEKAEASLDFAQQFTSIGASYDTTDLRNIRCEPRSEKLEKYAASLADIKSAGPLIPLLELQRFAGLHTFMARFLQEGQFFCNSAYCCLRASPTTKSDMRPVSHALVQDAENVLRLLRQGVLAPLTSNPSFAHPGRQGFSADASGSANAKAYGWGVHLQGVAVSGKWPPGIKKALSRNQISISPLELLAAAIAVDVAGRHRDRLPPHPQIILRCNSESACAVANSQRADSAPMLEALRIFTENQHTARLKVRLLYIPTTENKIADSLSRGEALTLENFGDTGNKRETTTPPERLGRWCARLLATALQAARHKGDPQTVRA